MCADVQTTADVSQLLHNARSVVVKVGSQLLVDAASNAVRRPWMDALVDDLQQLRCRGAQVVVVSSGAVALGRTALGMGSAPLKLPDKQAAAACGQSLLVDAWRHSAQRYDWPVAQILLTLDDSEARRRYTNACNTLRALLQRGVLPIVNENDTVATAELRFGDNDRLAARVAQMVGAHVLVLLSDIDGLYTCDPTRDSSAEFVPHVPEITPEIERMAGHSRSCIGSGGMITKLSAARVVTEAGSHMMIARGTHLHPLRALREGRSRCTVFAARGANGRARKQWIGGAVQPSGHVCVDAGAVAALQRGKSLLPAGVSACEGTFSRGDAVWIMGPHNQPVGKGLIAYSAQDTSRILGRRSQDIAGILGYRGPVALIHRDDMVVYV